MNRTIDRLKLIFLGVFAAACVAVLVYHVGWEWPRQRCEAQKNWWDGSTRTCAHPVLLSDITGRTTEEVLAEKAAREKAKAEPANEAAPSKSPAP